MGYFDPDNYMKVDDLKHNYLYKLRCRNARVGVWNEDTGDFTISRHKFRENFTFPETHHDLSQWHGTAFPQEELELCPFDVNNFNEKQMLDYLNEWEERQTDPHPRDPYDPKKWVKL